MRKLPSPGEIGLPEKFDKWRSKQEDLLGTILESEKRGKRAVATCAPTGIGKSVCFVASALLSKEPTCIVTSSRGLQSQYLDDFQEIGMVDIRGRSNYQCEMREDYSCEEGYAARCPYKGSVGCPCSAAEMAASTSYLVVTNYDKWMYAKRYGQGMSHFTRVVFDEAHESASALSRQMQITLHHKVESDLAVDFPTGAATESFLNWKTWAAMARGACDLMAREAWVKIQETNNPKPAWVKNYTYLRNLLRKLGILATGRVDNWIVEEVKDGFQFDPIRLAPYAESTLLLKVPRIIAGSATLRPKSMYMNGLKKEDFEFHEFDSDFDPRRCPIYYIPTMRVDDRNKHNIAYLWLLLDQIAAKRRDRKGLVETVSFARQRDIVESSRFWESMIINEQGEPPTDVLEQYYGAGDGTILVSPSFGQGYDFKDELCRWGFMTKIPFDPPSKIVKAREHDDPEYRGHRAMQKMVQFFGRFIRSKQDWGEGFIGDMHLQWFLPRYGHLAPRSFHNVFRTAFTVPAPPRKELM